MKPLLKNTKGNFNNAEEAEGDKTSLKFVI